MSEDQLPVAMRRIVDAINAGDADAFTSAFTENGSIEDWGRTLTGAAEIRQWAIDEAIGPGATMHVAGRDPSSDAGARHRAGIDARPESRAEADPADVRFVWRGRGFTIESTAHVIASGDRAVSLQLVPFTR